MEFTYVHVQSDMMNISVRQNMQLFMTFTSNHCMKKSCGDLIDNRADAPICVLEYNGRHTNLNLRYALNISLLDGALWSISKKKLHVNKKHVINYIYLLTYKLSGENGIRYLECISVKQTGDGDITT